MGYAFMFGSCAACHQMIGFNPHLVPSIRFNNVGPKQPICQACAERWNQLHPEQARPILEGAYVPFDENEL
jgi:hypothetical protein